MRPFGNANGNVRSIYFRPFITSLTEDFSPEWNKQTFFGRSDQVVTYGTTVRSIFLTFELHAFAPEDIKIMYMKISGKMSFSYFIRIHFA